MSTTPPRSPTHFHTDQPGLNSDQGNPVIIRPKAEPLVCKIAKSIFLGSLGAILAYLVFGANAALFVFTAVAIVSFIYSDSQGEGNSKKFSFSDLWIVIAICTLVRAIIPKERCPKSGQVGSRNNCPSFRAASRRGRGNSSRGRGRGRGGRGGNTASTRGR